MAFFMAFLGFLALFVACFTTTAERSSSLCCMLSCRTTDLGDNHNDITPGTKYVRTHYRMSCTASWRYVSATTTPVNYCHAFHPGSTNALRLQRLSLTKQLHKQEQTPAEKERPIVPPVVVFYKKAKPTVTPVEPTNSSLRYLFSG